jgi:cytoskeleton protein RodZ
MSVGEVARALKLPRATIEAIEAERMDRIAATYLRGYVTNYARLVGLDAEPLLAELATGDPEPPLRHVAAVQRRGRRFEHFVRYATYALVTTVIVPPLVYFFVQGGARLFESGDGAGTDVVETTAGERTGYRERVAEALAVKPLSPTTDPTSPLSASALPMSLGAEREAERTATSDPDADAPAMDAPVVDDPTVELALSLNADSWVEIEAGDGERLEFDLLRAGDRRSYRAEPPFKLLLGRGSAVSLTLDGEPVAFDGHDVAGVAEVVVGTTAPAQPPAEDAASSGD